MKRTIFHLILLAPALILSGFMANAQPTGREIMLRADEKPDGETRKSVMTMELVNKRGSKRVRTMQSYSLDVGKDTKSIMFFQEPADVVIGEGDVGIVERLEKTEVFFFDVVRIDIF